MFSFFITAAICIIASEQVTEGNGAPLQTTTPRILRIIVPPISNNQQAVATTTSTKRPGSSSAVLLPKQQPGQQFSGGAGVPVYYFYYPSQAVIPVYIPERPSVIKTPSSPVAVVVKVISILGASWSSPSIVCSDMKYLIPSDQIKFYACCVRNIYYWPAQNCSDYASTTTKRPWSSTWSFSDGTTSITCNGVQYILSGPAPNYSCCGTNLYDRTKAQCDYNSGGGIEDNDLPPPIDDDLPPPIDEETTVTSCQDGYLCCADYMPVYDPNKTMRCCPGVGPYDPTSSSCLTVQGRY